MVAKMELQPISGDAKWLQKRSCNLTQEMVSFS